MMKGITLTKIKQHFTDNSITDIRGETKNTLNTLQGIINKNSSIAIAVGSRGIDNLQTVVKEVVDFVRSQGANPFVVPAMGSHGGATAEGQQEVLAGYGITETAIGAPIKSSMEVVELANTGLMHKIYMDKNAYESDGVILINKIKPHTDFHATYESGLVKMAVIGLGKERGAEAIHHYGVYGLKELIPASARRIFAENKIIAGIGLIENAHDKTMMISALSADAILEQEPHLLEIAKKNRPSFPIDQIDVLIIDQMGKNISGVGMDTNIIGRLKIYDQPEPASPKIRSIIVNDITEESHGNATGIGLADIISRQLFEKIDFAFTYKNIATSSFLERGKIPHIAENDKEALDLAMRNCGNALPGKERIIRIKDTLHLEEIYVSQSILSEIKNAGYIEVLEREVPILNDQWQFNDF